MERKKTKERGKKRVKERTPGKRVLTPPATILLSPLPLGHPPSFPPQSRQRDKLTHLGFPRERQHPYGDFLVRDRLGRGGSEVFPLAALFHVFGTNRGPRPSVDGLASVDGLGPRLAPNTWLFPLQGPGLAFDEKVIMAWSDEIFRNRLHRKALVAACPERAGSIGWPAPFILP